ncbi:hypothetical protein [Sphingobacterium sp. DR205]|uniref:hypothetical protein n=1 Tax=Sphingobacterium sp. DR205 TaxID=2713573 RepID=UPI0013E4C31E|nr:hypothetical protein [Sphingobacterium sp. DR205]QIH33483.1 hypothetical protein G6053_11560 [Sphingobacterium sp. DR205]
MKIQILSLAILCFMLGCSKEGTPPHSDQSAPSLKMATVKTQIEKPFNPKNPADSIGITHNQALTFVYQRLSQNENFSPDMKQKLVGEFFKNRYGGDPLKSLLQRHKQNQQIKNLEIKELTEKLGCSRTLAKNIDDIFLAAKEMKSPADYSVFKKKIMIVEDNVLSGKIKISRTEADQLLHFTSIYRHSMFFWMEAISKSPGKSEAEFLRKFIRAILGAGSDAYGAVVSLITYVSFRYVLEDAALDSAMMLWAFDS